MLKPFYAFVLRFPKLVILAVLGLSAFLAVQIPSLRWETDARVYLPKGHPAIRYDEEVDELFGVKDALIIAVVNDKEGIFNPETLARIDRITRKVAALPGVIARRTIDVASLSTASFFSGTEDAVGTIPLMPRVPETPEEIQRLKRLVYDNADLFVGNIVSADGKAAMIRAKLKEGAANRYMTYWQIRGILAAEEGGGRWPQQGGQGGAWPRGGSWPQGGSGQEGGWPGKGAWPQGGGQGREAGPQGGGAGPWPQGGWQHGASGDGWELWKAAEAGEPDDGAVARVGDDRFYLAGRPVIEVTAGLHALEDLRVMIPALIVAIGLTLFLIFRTWRGVLLPMGVMALAITWTMGVMALAGVPMYTISTMLPVILVAVSIGDAVHLLSHYYDEVLHHPEEDGRRIMGRILDRLGAPLITTTVTTGVGFLALLFAEMPPFRVFGLFTVLGIAFSWLLTVSLIPAVLVLLRPKVGRYLAKRRALRVYSEQNRLTRFLVRATDRLQVRPAWLLGVLLALSAVAAVGATRLYVDSSWLSDFRKDSPVVRAHDLINQRFSGSVFLNVVFEGHRKDAFKDPGLLRRMEAFQRHMEGLPHVGDSRSIVDYVKSMNMALHADDPAYDRLPETREEIAEYLYLFSVSGRPEQLDEVMDFDYRRALVTIAIRTDHTQALKAIIDEARRYIDRHFAGTGVEAHFAGSANNSYVWADLLIRSQTLAIGLSKLGILAVAALLFRSFVVGLFAVIPVTVTTLLIAGFAGWAAIPLDVSTALAAGVAIGVGVDYAVHYIFRYLDERRRAGDHLEATRATMRSVGKTIVFNATVVTVGFAVLLFSRFPPHVKLGSFVAAYMVVSCLVALLSLPLAFRYRRWREPAGEAAPRAVL